MAAGQALWAILNGKKYSLSVGHGAVQMGPLSISPTAQMGMSIAGTKQLIEAFIEAFQALTGRKV